MTPPVQPNGSSEPEDPLNPDPFATYAIPASGPDAPLPAHPVTPSRKSAPVLLAIAAVLGGALVFWAAHAAYLKFSGDLVAITHVTTTKPTPFAEAGDCALVTGSRDAPAYTEIPCTDDRHNYRVSKVLPSTGEKCSEDEADYVKYTKGRTAACLIPNFADGRCYDFTLASQLAEPPLVECGGPKAAKVRTLGNTADEAACGVDARLALAYPEIKTTYCFTLKY